MRNEEKLPITAKINTRKIGSPPRPRAGKYKTDNTILKLIKTSIKQAISV
jgi:hypothetical protein